jgi:hypothetical protein
MDFIKLYDLLAETTVQLRKGPMISGEQKPSVDVVHLYLMPDESEAPESMVKVDLHFLTIGVDMEAAERGREDFLALLATYPDMDRIAGGPSYIEVGAVIGDQGAAFQMFALGSALGLWGVITPGTLGFTGEEANRMAGNGLILMSGYKNGIG